jgi:hypothetical protein
MSKIPISNPPMREPAQTRHDTELLGGPKMVRKSINIKSLMTLFALASTLKTRHSDGKIKAFSHSAHARMHI